jgi:hypothetical protein
LDGSKLALIERVGKSSISLSSRMHVLISHHLETGTPDDVVTFVGDLGTKAGSFEKDGNTYQVVEHSLNNVTYKVDTKAAPSAPKAETEFTQVAPF